MNTDLDGLQKLVEEAEFSLPAKERINQILTEAKNRGGLILEEKAKLLEIVEADMALDKTELEARKDVISILEELKEKLEK